MDNILNTIQDVQERCEKLTALRKLYDVRFGLYSIPKTPEHFIDVVEQILPGTAKLVKLLMEQSSSDTSKQDIVNNIVNRWVTENRDRCEVYEELTRRNSGKSVVNHVKYDPVLEKLRKWKGGARRRSLSTRRKSTTTKKITALSLLRKRRSVKKVSKKTKKYVRRVRRI